MAAPSRSGADRARRKAERPADHARHDARGPRRQLRLCRSGDAESRSSRRGRRAIRSGALVGSADVALARQPDDRTAAVHSRRPEQRTLHARRRRADARGVVRGRGVRHGGLRQLLRARRQFGLDRGFAHYDASLDPAPADRVSLELERRGDRTVAAATGWLRARRRQAVLPLGPSLRSARSVLTAVAVPRAVHRSPYDGEIAFDDALIGTLLDETGYPGRRRWSSSPAITARASASTARARTVCSSTRARCACRS